MEDRSKRRARLILIVGFLLALLAAVGTFVVASGGQQTAITITLLRGDASPITTAMRSKP